MWTVRMLTAGVMNAATGPLRRLFPGRPGGQPWRIQLSGGSDPEGTDCASG